MRHIIPISGKDSAATALVQIARAPDLSYEYIFCDVEMELPETYAWLGQVEKTLEIEITRVGRSLEDVIAENNMLPSDSVRFCTKYGKIFPLRDYIGKQEATQYLGIRADEADRVGLMAPENITAVYPLIELGMSIQHVYQILQHKGILPPNFFWQRLYDTVLKRQPGLQAQIDRLKPWDRAAVFSWRSRSNCACCFYQRRYEWIGLLEHHPDLFARAEEMEKQYGSGDRRDGESFTWIKDLPLPVLRERAESIFEKRVKSVISDLSNMAQGRLWQVEFDPLTVKSCGLYCGK